MPLGDDVRSCDHPQLVSALGGESAVVPVRSDFHDAARMLESAYILILTAESGIAPAGILVSIWVPKSDRRRGFYFVDELYVLPAFRRRGIARALVHDPVNRAKQEGLAGVRLLVRPRTTSREHITRRWGSRRKELSCAAADWRRRRSRLQLRVMNTVDLIRKKRNGDPLSREEIEHIITRYVAGEIPDYQIAAWLMAVYFRSMNDEETAILTDVMAHSGAMLDLSNAPGFPVDKHSTGGVGDTTTLVLIPLLAAAGLTVAKLSGRSLGHTGGTIDKLESIPGFRTDLSREEFLSQVERFGVALADHTEDMVPADRLLYELRDVTCTVDSLPLIVASIMSKKIAGGAKGIVIDVKTGEGAFLTKLEDSRKLARALVSIGAHLGRTISALITGMSQPLGAMVGNALEVREAIDTLRGKGPEDLANLCCQLGAELVIAAGQAGSHQDALTQLRCLLTGGEALAKFQELVQLQGGDPRVVDDPERLPSASKTISVTAEKSGVVAKLNALDVGRAASLLGAGRFVKEDQIDPAVGIEILAKIGDPVSAGDKLSLLHVNEEGHVDEAMGLMSGAYIISDGPVEAPPLMIDRIAGDQLESVSP